MPRILIADSDPSSSNAICLWLVHRMGMEDVSQVQRGGCLLARLDRGDVDVVLMDWSLPDRPDAARFQEIRETRPDLVLVLLSEKAEIAPEAAAYGATFIHKAISPAEFMTAIRKLLNGRKV